MAEGGDKTEKATPKKREEARKKGQVAKSQDVNGAVILLAGLMALSAFGPRMVEHMESAMVTMFGLMSTPQVVDAKGVGSLFTLVGKQVGLAAAPVIAVCSIAAIAAAGGQTGFKPSAHALKPDAKKLNPLKGFKNILGPNTAVEAVKSVTKVALVAAIAYVTVKPQFHELAALVGMPAQVLLPETATLVFKIAQRVAIAYLLIAAADFGYQKWRTEKSLRMDKQEIKDEFKGQGLPAEIKSAQRRRAMEMSSKRMMEAVPTADVIVVNPTHYSVALKYDPARPAPIVVAKGMDHVALRIRAVAAEHGVPIVPDPPLARSLHAAVEVDRMIPEEMFHAVAQLLAYVYRVAGARKALA